MSTGIKRLSFVMLYCKAKSQNAEFSLLCVFARGEGFMQLQRNRGLIGWKATERTRAPFFNSCFAFIVSPYLLLNLFALLHISKYPPDLREIQTTAMIALVNMSHVAA